ncbi:MAG: alpha/beta hydrolase [Ferruginibacter sp.]|nr:alpha/beta hydrolase [Ferruginibacter sp.]
MRPKKYIPNLKFPGAVLVIVLLIQGCAFRSIKRSKGIEYLQPQPSKNIGAQKLNIFAPRKNASLKNVLIFIHGGNWNSGNRSLYSFLGSRMARKNIVTVVIDYPLSPKASYKEMAFAAAASVKWVKEHIESYGGNPKKIFISGHSAGGHLAALVSADNRYFDSLGIANPIKGTILIDAGALDMFTYLKQEGLNEDHTYLKTFTKDPAEWKKASPVNYLHTGMPKMLIYQGSKTYPFIKETNEIFLRALRPIAPATKFYMIKGKKHIAMITQFFKTWNPRYKEIADFMK